MRKGKLTFLTFMVFVISSISTAGWAASYYVATTGTDTNPGTLSAPFRTIQKGLNVLQAGDNCIIRGGTYNEALVLKQSGTSTARITIQNYPGETVTVNSGNSKALRSGGRRHYYTIDGLRLISSYVVYDQYGRDYTLDFEDGIWDGETDPNGGNNGFIIRNCYIEGAILFYGHYNTVENCELNGKTVWGNGIMEKYAASHHNLYRKNNIYGYTGRGIWSMQRTDGVIIEGNVIHDITTMGIDCDGAWHPVYNSVVRGNTVYKVGGRGIEMENAFNSVVEKNVVFSTDIGIHYINYGFGPDYNADAEYRTTATNGMVRNNLVYGNVTAGVILRASPSVKVYNNTIHGNVQTKGYYGGIALVAYGGYYSTNADVKNNIVAESGTYALWIEGPSSGLQGLLLSNNQYFHSTKTKSHYVSATGQTFTPAEYTKATGQELASLFSNPAFVNAAGSDFHLKSTSPGVDAGLQLAEVPTDLDGTARPKGARLDIGAYEFTTGAAAIIPPNNLRFAP